MINVFRPASSEKCTDVSTEIPNLSSSVVDCRRSSFCAGICMLRMKTMNGMKNIMYGEFILPACRFLLTNTVLRRFSENHSPRLRGCFFSREFAFSEGGAVRSLVCGDIFGCGVFLSLPGTTSCRRFGALLSRADRTSVFRMTVAGAGCCPASVRLSICGLYNCISFFSRRCPGRSCSRTVTGLTRVRVVR